MIRKVYWSKDSYSSNHELMGSEHIDHCIDGLRQYIMCNADISPMNWVWIEQEGRSKAVAQVAHTCRSFDDIKDWAGQRKLTIPFRTDVRG
jgi:hypothetical protein